MTDWKQRMADILTAGRPPTNDELEEALAGALAERKALQEQLARVSAERDGLEVVVRDMGAWMSKIVSAFLAQDVDKLTNTIGEFIAKNVKVISKAAKGVH